MEDIRVTQLLAMKCQKMFGYYRVDTAFVTDLCGKIFPLDCLQVEFSEKEIISHVQKYRGVLYYSCGAQQKQNNFGKLCVNVFFYHSGQKVFGKHMIKCPSITVWLYLLDKHASVVEREKESETEREGERERTKIQTNKGICSTTWSHCPSLSHLPVVVCVITPQLKCLCLCLCVCVCVPCGLWWPHLTMSTMWPGQNRQFHTSDSVRGCKEEGQSW